MSVRTEQHGPVWVVTLCRPERRNAIDPATAEHLLDAFARFEQHEEARVAVLHGEGGNFCAGADLKALLSGEQFRLDPQGDGPLGPTRRQLAKPVIAAVEGYAVAGGLELACWCDMRVADPGAVFGVYCRRWGVPLIDGGTVRLPRLIGQGRALDMVLTGRSVTAEEALAWGLADRVSEPGQALPVAIELAQCIAAFPWTCVLQDRRSVYEQAGLPLAEALRNEGQLGQASLASPELVEGVRRFGR